MATSKTPPPALPAQFRSGDSLLFTEIHSDYPASAGWTLHYGLFKADKAITLDASASGDAHQFAVPATTTAKWPPGRYDYARYVTHTDSRRLSLSAGQIEITPDLGSAMDGRSHARKMLEAIEALLENRASQGELDLLRVSYNTRDLERDRGALLTAHAKYKAEVASEDQADALARGENIPRSIKARFTR